MRLRRIEAVRYGALADLSLGDLGEGLTVVHGPNEAGKSTLIALVRHVLYGYPTQRDKEPGYFVPGGAKRLGRLVFEDAEGAWVIERSDGPRGGNVEVRALRGPARPDLVQSLTRGVSPEAYRVVFGFGLDEMAAIEQAKAASTDDIVSRLYAASWGLRVSPQEVRASIDAEAAGLFKRGGKTPLINTLDSRLKDVRKSLREQQKAARSLTEEQRRLAEVTESLARARERREDAHARVAALAAACERAEDRVRTIDAEEEALIDLRRGLKELSDELEAVVLDPEMMEAAADVEALIEQASAVAGMLDTLAAAERSLTRARARESDAIRRTGLSEAVARSLADAPALLADVEEGRDDLQRLALQVEQREEAVTQASAEEQAAQTDAERALATLGISPDDALEQIGARLDAIDALEARRIGAPSPAAAVVPALIMLVSGLAAAAAGVLLAEWLTVAVGVALAGAGAWLLATGRGGRAGAVSADDRACLATLGLGASAGPLELARMRRALEAARTAVKAADGAAKRLEEARRDVGLARDALQTRQALWSAWLAEHGLDPGLTPAGAMAVLQLVAEARLASVAVAEAASEAEGARAQLDETAGRIAEGARRFVEVPQPLKPSDVALVRGRLAERLSRAREMQARHQDLSRRIDALGGRIGDAEERLARARTELRDVLERFDLAEGGTHEDLREMLASAERQAAESDAVFEALTEERNRLEERLAVAARDRTIEELRFEEAALAERIAETTDRYLVLGLASHLLARAQERYERERQPEVVKQAERVFSTITEGRYVALSVPVGGGRIEVFDARSGARRTDELSRGAAEQLYLALRVGLISCLGEVGVGLPVLMDDVLVNFDPERRRGAAAATAELASARQVVFFTCHPETVDLFEAVAPGHVRLELARCAI